MVDRGEKISIVVLMCLTFAFLIHGLYVGGENSKTNKSVISGENINYSNKTLIQNDFDVDLPQGQNNLNEITIYDGSERYYFNATENSVQYDCSTKESGCTPFDPNQTYLECEKTYHSVSMEEYCVTKNNTNSVTMKTDERLNHITAPVTQEKYDVIKTSEILDRDSGFENTWDLEFIGEDRYLVTELYGNIHDVKDGDVKTYQIEVQEEGPMASGEDDYYTGLMGVTKHPDFENNKVIYLHYSYEKVKNGEREVVLNKVSKFRIDRKKGKIEKLETIIDGIPGRLYYHGGRMSFGPEDTYLFITTGSADYEKAQNNSYLGGKILRLYPNGSIPEGNPYDNEVYAKGMRNPQGIDFNPETGVMTISQHGPYRRDNIAKVGKATNLGWPQKCKRSNPNAKIGQTILCTQTWTLAPSGLTFVDDKDHPWYNDLFVAGLRSKQVHRISFEDGKATGNEIFWFNGFKSEAYPNQANDIRDVEFKNGDLWILHDFGFITKLSPDQSMISKIFD